MQWKTSRPGLLFFGLWLALVAGCRPAPPPPAGPPPYLGVQLRVACPAGVPAAVIMAQARAWALHQGAEVQVVEYDSARGPEQVEKADVWVLRPDGMPHAAVANQLLPVPPSFTARDSSYSWVGLLPVYREQLLLWGRTPEALPLLGESPLCCYRSDLLADPQHRKAFREQFGHDLGVPASWEEFAEIAEFFHTHTPSGKPAPSLPPLSADDRELDRLFYSVAACYARLAVPEDAAGPEADESGEFFSFHYDVKTGKPRIDGPGFVHALGLLQRLQKCRPAAAHPTPALAFRARQTVLCLADAGWLVPFQGTPALHDRFGICPMPGSACYFDYRTGRKQAVREPNRVPYLGSGGWLMVVPRGGPHPEAAWSLLADLSGPARSAQVALEPEWGGGPTRSNQLRRERWDAFDLDPERTAQLKESLNRTLLARGIKNPVVCLRTPDQAAHRAALTAAVRAALRDGADPAKALAGVARRWEELDRQRDEGKGKGTHQREYRTSLGLLVP